MRSDAEAWPKINFMRAMMPVTRSATEFRGFGQGSALIGDLEKLGELPDEIIGIKAQVEKYMLKRRNKILPNRLDSLAN